MKYFAAVLLFAFPVFANASLVIGNGSAPGIVAENGWQFLDSDGRVWRVEPDGTLLHVIEWDVTIPVGQIKFWTSHRIVTVNDEFYWLDEGGEGWVNVGCWPGPATLQEVSSKAPELAVPNPTLGAARIEFLLRATGHVSVCILAADGRAIRSLLEGHCPAGEYEIIWDRKSDRGTEAPAGTYFVQIATDTGAFAKKIVVLK